MGVVNLVVLACVLRATLHVKFHNIWPRFLEGKTKNIFTYLSLGTQCTE